MAQHRIFWWEPETSFPELKRRTVQEALAHASTRTPRHFLLRLHRLQRVAAAAPDSFLKHETSLAFDPEDPGPLSFLDWQRLDAALQDALFEVLGEEPAELLLFGAWRLNPKKGVR